MDTTNTNAPKENAPRAVRAPKIWEALIPPVFLMVLIVVCTVWWGVEPHIPLVLACVVTIIVALRCGYKWDTFISAMLDSIGRATEALLIMMCVGMLIGTWVWSGTMPAMVYYGLDILNASTFLVVGAILCGIVGIATGSSWTASGTVGVALMGIGAGLGINPAISAGMVISGAYMGDKFSPLSDSTNIAAAGAETPLYDHVRAMVTTTFPSFLIALVIYGVLGVIISDRSGYDASTVRGIQDAIAGEFYISPWIICPVLVIIAGAIWRVPAIPSLLGAAILGAIVAIIAQGATVPECLNALHYGFEADTGHEVVDSLLNRGGLDSMMWTVSLIMFALAFGGLLEKCGFIEVLLGGLVKRCKSVGSLVMATIISGIVCDFVLTDQYLAILIPSRLFAKAYDDKGLSRSFLSRTTEDGATLWSPLCPWNGCGAYQSATLGVPNFQFLPYAFMNLINPVYAIVISYLGLGIRYADGTTSRSRRKAAKAAKAGAAK